MNKTGLLLTELHDAETELAEELRAVADRQTADPGTHYPCLTLAQQCDTHIAWLRRPTERPVDDLPEPRSAHSIATVAAPRGRSPEHVGYQPEPGLLLLRDLRQLYLLAEAVNVHWILLGQVAQALRDHALLREVTALHNETLIQIKWFKTRLKNAAPQVLATVD